MSQSIANYRFKVAGLLTPNWGARLGCFDVTTEAGNTILVGHITDQAALHGLLRQFNDLGLTLLLVEKLEPQEIQGELP